MTVSIGLGLMEFPFASASGYWRWVDLCEAGGVDSLWQTDRIVSRAPILEAMTVMAALAGRTRRLKFGMNVVSLALRDPVLLAKQCATIDVLSEGRLLPGVRHRQPARPEWQALGHRPDVARRAHRRGPGDHPPPVARGRASISTGATITCGVPRSCPSRAARSADVDRRLLGGGDPPHRPLRHGVDGGPETPAEAGRIVAAIRAARGGAGRVIDEDHYGAGFPFHFGRADDAAHQPASQPTASAPAAIRRTISRSATPPRFSRGSPPTWRPACPSSSCGRWRAATMRCWRRQGG